MDKETGTRLVTYSNEICLVNLDSITLLGTDAFDVESKSFVETKFVEDFALSPRPPLVISAHIRCAVDAFRLWLDEPSAQQSFLLVGPEGCGKRYTYFCLFIPEPLRLLHYMKWLILGLLLPKHYN